MTRTRIASIDFHELFSIRAKRQRYLDVEAALAESQAEVGLLPKSAAAKISRFAKIELLDEVSMNEHESKVGHHMVPLISELARAVGDPEGQWVHWGATTQNIEQTGDVLGFRIAHSELVKILVGVMEDLSDLGKRTAATPMAGRTHWQHAVPITFGLKVAAWTDVMGRHLERLHQLKPRLFTSMTGGAAGTFASLGEDGPAIQDLVAKKLGLTAMAVPARNIVDQFTEFVCIIAMVAATAASIAEEVARLMAVEFGEVSEFIPNDDVGSSTMPQKRNPKLCATVVTAGARVRGLVPTALEAMIQSHEVDGARSLMIIGAVEQACVWSGDCLTALSNLIAGLEVFPDKMLRNLQLSDGLISAEAIMMALAARMGRQTAHKVVHAAANRASREEISFLQALASDEKVVEHLSLDDVERLLAPEMHVGLSANLSLQASERARGIARRYS